jgi:hypothetical protein
VSGRRIQPGVHVALKEGDTVRIGCSSRVYELHWVRPTQVVRSKKQKKKKLMLRLLGLPPLYTIKEEEGEGEGEEEAEDAHQVA